MALNKSFLETFLQQTKDQMIFLNNQTVDLKKNNKKTKDPDIDKQIIFINGQIFQLNVIYEWFNAIYNELNEEEDFTNYSIM